MKLIHLTDIHLTQPGQTIAGRDPIANFDRALEHALDHHADAALIAITGDLSDWGDAADYRLLKAKLAQLTTPVALCIGNHDDRPTFLETFPEAADENGFVQHVRDTPEGRLIFLDTWAPQTHAGAFCEMRRAWLSAQIDSAPGACFLFMHHNPIPTYVAPMDSIRLLDDGPFRALVGDHRDQIRHIFHGHCHLPMNGSIHGVPVSSIRGTNHAGWPHYGEKRLLSGAALPEAYGVVFIAPDHLTAMMVEFGYAGEIISEASPDYASWDREAMAR